MGTPDETPALSAQRCRVAIVAARYNAEYVESMLEGARAAWERHGGVAARLRIERVPGAFELPLAAQVLARHEGIDAIVALGCIIRGDTAHFEYVAGECTRGLMRVMLDTGVPVSFGVLTVNTAEQARERALPGALNKGAEALETALAMCELLRRSR